MRTPAFLFLSFFSSLAFAQGVQPYVDHYDSLKTQKRSEGLYVNGLEWGTWKYYDRSGRVTEQVDFKAGQRDGRMIQYYPGSEQAMNDGWFKQGRQDSLTTSFYKNGQLMERGLYRTGVK